ALEIISSDATSSYGFTPDFLVIDELSHWKEAGAALWESLFSAAGKRGNSFVVIISNAGTGLGESWQWAVREAARTDPAWYLSRLEGAQASWIAAATLEEQRRMLPDIAFRRLWLNEWTTGSGDAIEPDLIQAALTLPGPMAGAEQGWSFFAGLDIGLSRDASALVVVGRPWGGTEEGGVGGPLPPMTDAQRRLRETYGWGQAPLKEHAWKRHTGTDRLRLALVKVWRPERGSKVELEVVEQTVAD